MTNSREIEKLKKEALEELKKASTAEDLKAFEVRYLGRKGKVTSILRSIKDIPEIERKSIGKFANIMRRQMEDALRKKGDAIGGKDGAETLKKEWIDITLPGKKSPIGHLHPLTKIRREVEKVFNSLGFETVEGRELETEYYNFDALNIPADHPARDMWDTFWIKDKENKNSTFHVPHSSFLLRVHTSPAQIHYMEKHQPPFRIISPGKVFRYEATDASHDIEFYQFEGLVVGPDISVANFKHVILSFWKKMFGENVKMRLRPSFFPFVEPGFEIDISCLPCNGRGCSVCSQTGWLEMMGAGMVHPNVFKSVGYNPRLWQGYAFGVGLDRIAMMKYKIPDIRLFHANDTRFLKQF